jgi:type IV fimbrial biogenesis protein FimT
MFKNSKGVTLLELVVAIAIVAILASLAIPAFDNQLKNSRIVANTNLAVGAFNIARSEAINRGVQTTVVATANGWAVEEVASGVQIKLFEPDQKDITWSGYSPVIYNSTGFRPFGSSAVTLQLVDSRGIGRKITISVAGSTKVVEI